MLQLLYLFLLNLSVSPESPPSMLQLLLPQHPFVGLCELFLHDKHHFVHVRIIASLNQHSYRPSGCIRRISLQFVLFVVSLQNLATTSSSGPIREVKSSNLLVPLAKASSPLGSHISHLRQQLSVQSCCTLSSFDAPRPCEMPSSGSSKCLGSAPPHPSKAP